MQKADSILSIRSSTTVELKVRGSRFIAHVESCKNEDELNSILVSVRVLYPNATHYCYAAIFGQCSKIERYSDNGEPSGTAGRPILDVLKGFGIVDTVLIVIRYFGGTLLGTGGLVKAYADTARNVLEGADIGRKDLCS